MLLKQILYAKKMIPPVWLLLGLNITASLQYLKPKKLFEFEF